MFLKRVGLKRYYVNIFVYFCPGMNTLDIIKGIHPGLFLERELKKRNLKKGKFALDIGEYPQTIGAITKGHRRINIPLAMKIEQKLGLEEGLLGTLQVYYDIQQQKNEQPEKAPDISRFRTSLFWDTRISDISWESQKVAVIQRIFERGTPSEKKEIIRFYGESVVKQVLSQFRKP